MTGERWQRVRSLFEAAVERPPAERASFLAAETVSDEALRREVESLLAHEPDAAGFMSGPAAFVGLYYCLCVS